MRAHLRLTGRVRLTGSGCRIRLPTAILSASANRTPYPRHSLGRCLGSTLYPGRRAGSWYSRALWATMFDAFGDTNSAICVEPQNAITRREWRRVVLTSCETPTAIPARVHRLVLLILFACSIIRFHAVVPKYLKG